MSVTKKLARLSDDQLALHTHLTRYVPGFDRRSMPALDVRELLSVLAAMTTAAAAGEWTAVDSAIETMPAFADLLAQPRHAGHDRHLRALAGAAAHRDAAKFAVHMIRLRRIVRLVANDDPLRKGDRVSITRTRHGWYDGGVTGKVSSDRGDLVLGDDGERYEIEHRRDVRRIG